jgi:hypothetical protein
MRSSGLFYADMTAGGAISIIWLFTPITASKVSVDRWSQDVYPHSKGSGFKNAIYLSLAAILKASGSGKRSAGSGEKSLVLSLKRLILRNCMIRPDKTDLDAGGIADLWK